MRRLVLGGLTVALALSVQPVPGQAEPVGPGDPPHVTAWALPSAPDRQVVRNAAGLDTLTVVGVSLDREGRTISGVPADSDRLRRTAQGQGLQAELLMNNYSNRLEDFDPKALRLLLTHPARMQAVATKAARLVRTGGWDGLNVDFERYRRADGRALVSLLRTIRAELPDKASLSIDVSARTSLRGYRQSGYRLGGIAGIVDLVQLMTYDQHGPTWSGPGPVGSLDWAQDSIDAALGQVPASKLDIGVAGYGYTWPTRGTGRTLTVAQARRIVDADGATARWDATAAEWTATLGDGTVVWWSDKDSFAARRQVAVDRGLHGAAVWRLGSADRFVAPN